MLVLVAVDLADTDIIISYLYTIFRIKSVVRSAMITQYGQIRMTVVVDPSSKLGWTR